MTKNWCFWGSFCLSILFPVIAGILYLVNRDEHVLAVLCLLLTSSLMWLLLLCLGCGLISEISRLALVSWFISLLFAAFFVSYSSVLLHNYYKYNKLTIHHKESSLTRFDLTFTNTTAFLNYSLAVTFSVSQGRKKTGMYFESFQISSDYQNQRFSSISLAPFFVSGKMNKTHNSSVVVLHPILEGSTNLSLKPDEINLCQQDAVARIFRIKLTVTYVGFRCNADEYEKVLTRSGSMELPSKHKLKGSRTYLLKGISLPDGTGKWVDARRHFSWMVFLYCLGLTFSFGVCFLTDPKGDRLCCITLGLVLLPMFVVLLVREVKIEHPLPIRASQATLESFIFDSTNGVLAYSLSLEITIGPSVTTTGSYFSELEVEASYRGHNFTSFRLPSPSYLQGKRKHGARRLIFHPVLRGKSTIVPAGRGLRRYRKDRKFGCYTIHFALFYEGFETNRPGNPVDGTRIKRLAKFKRQFPEICNQKQVYSGPIF